MAYFVVACGAVLYYSKDINRIGEDYGQDFYYESGYHQF